MVAEVRITSIHNILATEARRAASFMPETTSRTPSRPRPESCRLRATQGPPRAEPCCLRAARRAPRHPRWRPRRGPPRSCATSSATMLVTSGTIVGRALCIILEMCRAGMHAKMLVKMARGHGTVTTLLLTWLEVRAPPVPRACRCHLRQHKH